MKTLSKLTLAAFLATSLSGCVLVVDDHDFDSWKSQQRENREMINGLALQTERSSVLLKLGQPNFSEAFIKGDDKYQVLYYRTQHRHSDGATSKDETTPLIFKNGKLIGWGNKTLASVY